MTYRLLLLPLIWIWTLSSSKAQENKILGFETLTFPDSVLHLASGGESWIDDIQFFKLSYLSDGLTVIAYGAKPKSAGPFPCIIANRGGNRDFGQWSPISIAYWMGTMASWGYIVVGSQYRGNDGGEGREEFGGSDINDVLNLIPVFSEIQDADTSRIGIEGGSRGGMMTYLALKETCRFKAAAVVAGVANSFLNIGERPDMENYVYAELIPDYWNKKEEELKKRSAVFWADQLCKETPLLLLHGSADWRVSPRESIELVEKLYAAKHPTRFILFEGADHGIREFREEMFVQIRRHFDYYLKDGNPLPNMEPHGR